MEVIRVASGPELHATAKRIATERGLKMRSRRGHGSGLVASGPSIVLSDSTGLPVVLVSQAYWVAPTGA